MKRIRMSKEKSEYKQIITPNPLLDQTIFKNIEQLYFNPYLSKKFMVLDKKVKELKEVKV